MLNILGLVLAIFLPGFLIVLIFFRESSLLEKIALSITFSIILTISIGIALGYDKDTAARTGGINSESVWKYEIIITSILLIAALISNIHYLNKKRMEQTLNELKPKRRKDLLKGKEYVKYEKL